MKFLFILSAVLLATAQANFFGQGFANIFQTLGQIILHQLDTNGVQLLNASVTAALALNTANALAKSSRDIQLPPMLPSFLTKLEVTSEEVISEVDKLDTTKDKADEVISSLTKSKGNAFTDFFAGTGESLTKTFKPKVDGVKTVSTAAGTTIKCGATNLLQKAKDSVSQLGQKLQPHIANISAELGSLVRHGSRTLNAMKQAGDDILQQTLTNMKEPVYKIGQTVVNAGETVVGHIAGALLGTNTDPAATTVAPCT